ncbi:DJ-1/PfpI family protein [Bacteroidota bacterium]
MLSSNQFKWNVAIILIFLFLFSLKVKCYNEKDTADESDLVFACLVVPGQNEIESLIWAGSIREFGGKFSNNTIWVFIPNNVNNLSESKRKELKKLNVELFPFQIDEETLRFPLAAKPFAAAAAEKRADGKYDLVAWIDPDNIFVNEPNEFIIPENIILGFRPVHHINIGSMYSEPLNEFWSQIYKDCNVPAESVFPMQPNVEDLDIRPYMNAGHLIFRPENGLMQKWRDNFSKLFLKKTYLDFYNKDRRYAVFVHQAILSATILSRNIKNEIQELPVKYNYPLNLYSDIPVKKRINNLNELVTARYDLFADYHHWNALIEIEEPLKSWIDEQFKLKGINLITVFDNKFGANNYLNRDVYEQYGWNITIAGLRDSIPGCNFYSDPFKIKPFVPDIKFDEIVNVDYYDAVAIMPATSYYQKDPFREIMNSKKSIDIIKEAAAKNIPISTICSGARVLAKADLIKGKKILGQPPFKDEYTKAGAVFLGKDFPPQIDGCVMTGSRDQYYSTIVPMALAIMIEERGDKGEHQTYIEKDFISSFPASFIGDSVAAKMIGGFGADGARSITSTSDGGIIIAGYTFSQGTGDADILVVKADSDCNIEWYNTFGGAGTEYGNNIIKINDGYLITGFTTSFGNGSRDVYVIKVDNEGNEIWSRAFGGKSWDVGKAACEATGDNYMICGYTHSLGAGEEDVYVLKIDQDGNEIWSKAYGGKRFEIANSIYALNNDNFIIGAATGTFGGGNCDLYLINIDKEGNEIWNRPIGGELESICTGEFSENSCYFRTVTAGIISIKISVGV